MQVFFLFNSIINFMKKHFSQNYSRHEREEKKRKKQDSSLGYNIIIHEL